MGRHVGRHRFAAQTEHLRAEVVVDEHDRDIGQLVTFGEEFEDGVNETDTELSLGQFIQHGLEEPGLVVLAVHVARLHFGVY